jgi:hypothetical protein
LHNAVLRQDRCGISFGGLAIGHTDQHVAGDRKVASEAEMDCGWSIVTYGRSGSLACAVAYDRAAAIANVAARIIDAPRTSSCGRHSIASLIPLSIALVSIVIRAGFTLSTSMRQNSDSPALACLLSLSPQLR